MHPPGEERRPTQMGICCAQQGGSDGPALLLTAVSSKWGSLVLEDSREGRKSRHRLGSPPDSLRAMWRSNMHAAPAFSAGII